MLPFLLLLACGGAPADTDDTDASGSGRGALRVSFGIDGDWFASMDEPCVGPFWGSIWLSDEVTGAGPIDGAESVADLHIESVDLSAGENTAVLTTVTDLPAGWVTILGFLDSDGNANVDEPDPDEDDPVTLPGDNEFEVVEDAETDALVFFGLLNP